MKDITLQKKAFRFAAYPLRRLTVFLLPLVFLPFAVFLFVISFYIGNDRWYALGSAIFILLGDLFLQFVALYYFWQTVIVAEDEIILRGIFGVIRQYKISDIDSIEYNHGVIRPGRPVLILVDKLIEDKTVKTDVNGKNRFVCVDFTRKNLQNVRTFWQGEIEYLPEKYRSQTEE